MIYEFRTYTLKVGGLPEVLKRFEEAYEHRKQFSELAAFWYTDIGPLNQIIHVWPYADLNERMRIRAESAKHPNWPPNHAQYLHTMESEIVIPAPFSVPLEPGRMKGPIFEMRYYVGNAGAIPGALKAVEAGLPKRAELSGAPFFGHTETGTLNKLIHIWPYESMDKRLAIRKDAVDRGIWPPPGGDGPPPFIIQHNKIMMAAPFSPIQ